MALKITTQIGTDRGITSEAYIRISNYNISKYGGVSLGIEIYMSQDSVPTETSTINQGTCKNTQIGELLHVSLITSPHVVDLTPIIEQSVFAFGYGKLKEKLVGLFGAENVVDC